MRTIILRALPIAGPAAVLVVALLIARSSGVVLIQRIPAPIFWTIIAAIIVAALLVVFIRWLKERREAAAVKEGIFEQGQASAQSARADLQEHMQDINKNLSTALQRLETGPDGKKTLYAIPWYLILGPSGCGKTTAIKNSGLNFPGLSQAERLQGTGGTRNCNWWLSSEAIIVDTAGRYVSAAEAQETQDEWLGFLDLLRRHRKRSPLNGLIVAYGIDELIRYDENRIAADAAALRERLDEIMERLQWAFPTYVVFMKCDLVDGFVEFFNTLPPAIRTRAWGDIYPLIEGADQNVAQRFRAKFGALVQRLKAYRPTAVAPEAQAGGDWAKAMMFPERFGALESKIQLLLDTLFQPNPYTNDFPRLRGTFFTSGMQEGAPIDLVVQEIEAIVGGHSGGPSERTPSDDAYFVKSLFTEYIRADRDVAQRTQASTRRMKRKRFVLSVATGVFSILCCAWTTVSCGLLQSKIGTVSDVAAELRGASNPLEEDLGLLDDLGQEVRKPWDIFPLAIGYRAKEHSEQVYARESRKRVLEELEKTALTLGDEVRDPELLATILRTELIFCNVDDPQRVSFDLGRALQQIAVEANDLDEDAPVAKRLETIAQEYLESEESLVSCDDDARASRLQSIATTLGTLHRPEDYLRELLRQARSVTDIDLDRLARDGDHLDSEVAVDGAFTADGWKDHLQGPIERVEDKVKKDNELIQAHGGTPSNVSDIRNQMIAAYVERFTKEWSAMFASIEIDRPAASCEKAAEVLDELLDDKSSAYLAVLREAARQTNFTVAERGLAGDAELDPIEHARQPLDALLAERDDVIEALEHLHKAVTACAGGGSSRGALADADAKLSRVKRRLGSGELADALSTYLDRPVKYARQAIGRQDYRDAASAYANMYEAWQSLSTKYPFADEGRDADVQEIIDFFGVDGKFQQTLSVIRGKGVRVQGDLERAKDRVEKIWDLGFIGQAGIKFGFTMTLAPDAGVPYGVTAVEGSSDGPFNKQNATEVSLSIHGDRVETLGPKSEKKFTVRIDPDAPDLTCKLAVVVSGVERKVAFEDQASVWNWFRLYDEASATPQGASDRLDWEFPELEVRVTAKLTPLGGAPSLFRGASVFRGFRLPSSMP